MLESPNSEPTLQNSSLDSEIADVARLLRKHAVAYTVETQALINKIAVCSMGPNHLWEDLGLPSRSALGELMGTHFPSLKALNHKQMRWKKFIYRAICEEAEILICKSPHCEACDEVTVCFAPED